MLHKFHRLSAVIIGIFVLFHLANHLAAFAGVASHIAIMDAFRTFYRHLIAETVFLACVTFQIFSGINFVITRWGQRRGFFEKLQAISGGYLALFLLIHVSAVLSGRAVSELDTNFYFAAAGLHVSGAALFFYPYYALAVTSFFTHIGCALHWALREKVTQRGRNTLAGAMSVFGLVLGLTIVLLFGGVFFEIQIPVKYLATYG